MNHKHNKKRNAGLLYEFLIRYMGNSVIEENDRNSKKCIKIFNKFFKKESELYKEFRLINALVNTTVESDLVASNIINDTKTYYKMINEEQLEREKSLLIREINHNLKDDSFFKRKIPDYKIYATIQNLFNEWKSPKVSNIKKLAEYEEALIKHLMGGKEQPKPLEEYHVDNIDLLVVKIMTEKLNKKFSGVLNEEQKTIIKNYIFSLENDNKNGFKKFLEELKMNTLKTINEYLNDEEIKNSDSMKNKLIETKNMVESEKLDKIDDKLIERFLQYSQLKQEILTD